MTTIHRKAPPATTGRLALAIPMGLFALLAGEGLAYADERRSAIAQSRMTTFDIPVQPLQQAFEQFAKQTGLTLLYDKRLLTGLRSVEISGSLTAEAALERLLEGHPLIYRRGEEGLITLMPRPGTSNGDAIELGVIDINAEADPAKAGDWVYHEPRSVSYISRRMIDNRPPRHAADMLEETTGVYTAVNQRDPGLSVNIRGVQDYGRVNMNIDGMRQNFNVSGHQQRNGVILVDPEMLAGIDIEKGTQAGQGGAGVLGGIATFRTFEAKDFLKDGKDVGGRVRMGHGIGALGNGTHFNGSGLVAIGDERGDILLGMSERRFGDYRAGNNNDKRLGEQIGFRDLSPNTFHDWLAADVDFMDGATRSQVFKFGLNLPDDQRVQASYLRTNTDGATAGPRLGYTFQGYRRITRDRMNVQNYALDYSYQPVDPLIDLNAKLYFVRTKLDRWTAENESSRDSGNYTAPFDSQYQTSTWGLQAENTARFELGRWGKVRWRVGGEFFNDGFLSATDFQPSEYQGIDSTPLVVGATPTGKRNMFSVFQQLQYEYDDWLTVDGGLRFDHYRTYGELYATIYEYPPLGLHKFWKTPVEHRYNVALSGGRWSPNFRVGIKPGVEWAQLYGQWGKGWRPPSVTEAFMSGSPHAGGGSGLLFPNPTLQPEDSKNWELGVNIFKDALFFDNDRFMAKVSYFDNRINNMVFLMLDVIPPRSDYRSRYGKLANVNNLKQVRYRGLEYQVEYDIERVYANLTYTNMIGQNKFCSRPSYMGGAVKATSVRAASSSLYVFSEDPEGDAWTRCGFIVGNATFTPADRGALTVGARFFDRKLDVGVRARYSAGFGNDLDKGAHRKTFDLAAWPSYVAYDMFASYKVSKNSSVFIALENATDEAYFVPAADFEHLSLARGRTLTGTLQYTF